MVETSGFDPATFEPPKNEGDIQIVDTERVKIELKYQDLSDERRTTLSRLEDVMLEKAGEILEDIPPRFKEKTRIMQPLHSDRERGSKVNLSEITALLSVLPADLALQRYSELSTNSAPQERFDAPRKLSKVLRQSVEAFNFYKEILNGIFSEDENEFKEAKSELDKRLKKRAERKNSDN